MSRSPQTVEASRTLAHAHALLREHKIHHLPVLSGGAIVGVLALSDLRLIETLKDVDPHEVRVEDAMTSAPYCVAPDAAIDEVADEMVSRRIGSAIVVEAGLPVGIFTSSDALRALIELVRGRPEAVA